MHLLTNCWGQYSKCYEYCFSHSKRNINKMVIGNRITKLHKNPIFFATDWKSECLLVSLFNSVSLWCVPTFGVDGGLIWIWHIHTLLTAEVQHVHTLKWSILLAHVQKQWEQQLSHIEKTHKLTCKVVQERQRCQEDPIYFILSHSKSHLITAHSLQPHSFFFLTHRVYQV